MKSYIRAQSHFIKLLYIATDIFVDTYASKNVKKYGFNDVSVLCQNTEVK